MIISPLNLDPVILAARAAGVLCLSRRIAYAQLSPQLTVVQTSSNFSALLEMPDTAVTGQHISDLMWEFVGLEDTLQEILHGRLPKLHLKMVNRTGEDGLTCYLTFLITPLKPEKPEHGLLLLIEDVTERGRLQQAIIQDRNELRLLKDRLLQVNKELHQLDQMKSLFMAMVAHDIRSPLGVISAYAELAQEQIKRGNTEKLPEYFYKISGQTNRLDYLLSDLLDLDAIEKGQLTLKREKTDLVILLQEVVDSLMAYFHNKNFQFELVLLPSPCYLWIDRQKITRVFYNLLSNAYKYTPPDGRIRIHMARQEENVIIQITDNGYGMNKDQIDQLFQPYFRTKEARESKISGSGLGLHIVKTFVEAHGGSIQVNSQLEHGSTFTVSLPILAHE